MGPRLRAARAGRDGRADSGLASTRSFPRKRESSGYLVSEKGAERSAPFSFCATFACDFKSTRCVGAHRESSLRALFSQLRPRRKRRDFLVAMNVCTASQTDTAELHMRALNAASPRALSKCRAREACESEAGSNGRALHPCPGDRGRLRFADLAHGGQRKAQENKA